MRILYLPLNGRDWTTLAPIAAGCNRASHGECRKFLANTRGNRGLGVMMAVGGARPEQTSFELDGIWVIDYAGGGPARRSGA